MPPRFILGEVFWACPTGGKILIDLSFSPLIFVFGLLTRQVDLPGEEAKGLTKTSLTKPYCSDKEEREVSFCLASPELAREPFISIQQQRHNSTLSPHTEKHGRRESASRGNRGNITLQGQGKSHSDQNMGCH